MTPHPDKFHTQIPAESRPLVILGGGGHAVVVGESAAASGVLVRGFLDDDPQPDLAKGPAPLSRLGGLNEFDRIGDAAWIIGVGGLALRRVLADRLADLLPRAARVVHPSAVISPSATIGRGVFIAPRAVVHSRASVGDHAIINTGAIIEHDCQIGRNAHIAPGTVLGGGVNVGADTLIGLGARVLPTITIGQGCLVGAGAVVVRDVPDGSVVVGVPAAPLG